jgi:hypothetical protein
MVSIPQTINTGMALMFCTQPFHSFHSENIKSKQKYEVYN